MRLIMCALALTSVMSCGTKDVVNFRENASSFSEESSDSAKEFGLAGVDNDRPRRCELVYDLVKDNGNGTFTRISTGVVRTSESVATRTGRGGGCLSWCQGIFTGMTNPAMLPLVRSCNFRL